MSPEEHFRRLKNDDAWTSTGQPAPLAARPARAPVPQRDRSPIWVTAVVGAALVLITLASVNGARPAAGGGGAGAPAAAPAAAPVAESTAPTRSASPTPTSTHSVDPTDPSSDSVDFHPKDPADMARAKTIIACFKSHGVKIVGLVPSYDDPKIYNIGYGGPHNDRDSIITGLKYQDRCFKAGGPAE